MPITFKQYLKDLGLCEEAREHYDGMSISEAFNNPPNDKSWGFAFRFKTTDMDGWHTKKELIQECISLVERCSDCLPDGVAWPAQTISDLKDYISGSKTKDEINAIAESNLKYLKDNNLMMGKGAFEKHEALSMKAVAYLSNSIRNDKSLILALQFAARTIGENGNHPNNQRQESLFQTQRLIQFKPLTSTVTDMVD